MTKNKLKVPNTLTTPEQLKKACEYKAEKAKKERETNLLQSFITWFNREAEETDIDIYLRKSVFPVNKLDVPEEFWCRGVSSAKHILDPILDKYLNDAGWKCEDTSKYRIIFKPL